MGPADRVHLPPLISGRRFPEGNDGERCAQPISPFCPRASRFPPPIRKHAFKVDLAPARSKIVERFLVGKEEDGWMVVPR